MYMVGLAREILLLGYLHLLFNAERQAFDHCVLAQQDDRDTASIAFHTPILLGDKGLVAPHFQLDALVGLCSVLPEATY